MLNCVIFYGLKRKEAGVGKYFTIRRYQKRFPSSGGFIKVIPRIPKSCNQNLLNKSPKSGL